GMPFDIAKSMGRWSSDAFTLYLRDHALISHPTNPSFPSPRTIHALSPVGRATIKM
ncbi:hypothetical protein BDR05DRAFT_889427, partial [Suillus weaverae]